MSADWKSDLAELFAERRRSRGTVYATRRLIGDLASLAVPRPRFGAAAQDLRHALRLFRQHAFLVSVTVAGLGLAIAMCTTVFSILNSALLRPFDMDDPSTVVRVERLYARGNSTSWPYSAFVELQRGTKLSSVQASLDEAIQLETPAGAPAPKPEPIVYVSGGYLSMLGGRAGIGRTIDPSDDRPGAAPIVVISDAFWKHHFNGDPAVVGRELALGSGRAMVVGVIRPGFSGPVDRTPSFWAPFAAYGPLNSGAVITPASQVQVKVFARTPAGMPPSARDEMTAAARTLPPIGFEGVAMAPESTTGVQFMSQASRIEGPDAAGVYAVIAVIFVVLALVLALACANVANLLLAGASARAREFGVRIAMGASQRRLLRQLLSESLVIGVAAGALGLLLSMWLVPALTRIVGVPLGFEVTTDFSVLLFTTVVAILCGLGAGLAPARYGSRSDVAGILKAQSLQSGSSPKASRLRRGFIGFQAAASMLLLVTAALFLRSAVHMTHADLGIDADRLLTVSLAYPRSSADGNADPARVASYLRTAIERIGALPSVEGASLTMCPPFSGIIAVTHLKRGGGDYSVFENRTDAEYFRTAGIRVVSGRTYTRDEVAAHAAVTVISDSLVREFFQGVDPIGEPLETVTGRGARGTIIGVVDDAVDANARGRGNGTMYRPLEAGTLSAARLMIRSADPGRMVREVERTLIDIDPQVRPSTAVMKDDVDKVMNEPRILAGLSGAVAGLALVLSVLGIFGVTSFVVGQRTQEVSVRMAIGASAGDVVRLLIRQNMWPVLGGLAVGLAGALLSARVLTAALFGISPYDPLAIVPAVLVLAGAALAAVAIPALRAARTDPASVLRQ